MDWGLFRGSHRHNRLLRDKMTFSPRFYYTCMVVNVLFRFYWVIPLFKPSFTGNARFLSVLHTQTFLGMMVEAVRRTFWSIIRVENESLNNFEDYRTIVAIPPIRLEDDKDKED